MGLGYLAAIGVDGSQRVHPMCPLLREDGIFAFIIPSPKQRDLHRDSRFAMHFNPRKAHERPSGLASQRAGGVSSSGGYAPATGANADT